MPEVFECFCKNKKEWQIDNGTITCRVCGLIYYMSEFIDWNNPILRLLRPRGLDPVFAGKYADG